MSARLLCVGTHHKTGTVWLRRVLHDIKADQGLPLMQLHNPRRLRRVEDGRTHLIVNWDSSFPEALFARDDARVIHMIRDPRDVLLSGARYHVTAPLGREKFLAVPRDDLGGLTYQEHLAALPDDTARMIFEMDNKHAETLQQMLDWDYGRAGGVEWRYEDLIADTDCTAFRAALEGFAIAGLDIDRAVESFWTHSLFGGVARKGARGQHAAHIRSGQVAQWRTKMPRAVAELYAERYGAALVALGYETDTSWVDETGKTREAA